MTIPTVSSFVARSNGWYSRSELLQMRLRVPRDMSPVATAWGFQYYPVFEKEKCISMGDKKPLTPKQIIALANGRDRLFYQVCQSCNVKKAKECFVYYNGNQKRDGDICDECQNELEIQRIKEDALQAVSKSKELIQTNGLLILDTETTGLDGDAEICEIAIINLNKEVVFSSLIKTSKPLSEEVIGIHGITNEMVANAPTWPQVYAQVKMLLSGKTVAIYNSEYDWRLIEQTSRIYGLPMIEFAAPCVMEIYAQFYGQWNDKRLSYKWQKLSFAAAEFQSEHTKDAHRAVSDCKMTVDVLNGMAKTVC